MNRLKPELPNLSELASMALDHLVSDPDLLAGFMAEAGYDPDGLRGALGSDAFNAGLIDHFARNESLLLALCRANDIRPETFMSVWHRLNPRE